MGAFLLTYRSFTTPQALLTMLKQRYNIQPPSGLSEKELSLFVEKKATPIRLRLVLIFHFIYFPLKIK